MRAINSPSSDDAAQFLMALLQSSSLTKLSALLPYPFQINRYSLSLLTVRTAKTFETWWYFGILARQMYLSWVRRKW